MTNVLDRLMLAGTVVFGGLVSRRVGAVDARLHALERSATPSAPSSPATSAQLPAMPLPTGHGLQVRGPAGEALQIPVCLPPGFELDSLVLRPDFLPAEQAPAAPVPPQAPAAHEPAPVPRERLRHAMQLVYGPEQAYTAQVDVGASAVQRPVGDPAVPTVISRPW